MHLVAEAAAVAAGQDVVAVARQIPNRQLVLVGHSMGAAVVLTATPLLGDRVIGIIAVEALRSIGLFVDAVMPALRQVSAGAREPVAVAT